VEHLRTVHFALIGASVALIILVLTKPFDLQRAVSQTQKILEIKQKWSSNWMKESLGATRVIRLRKASPDDEAENSNSEVPFSNTVQIQIWAPQQTLPEVLELTLEDSWMMGSQKPIGAFPGNLAEFKSWWDGLTTPAPAAFATSLARKCMGFDNPDNPGASQEALECSLRVAFPTGDLLRDYAVDEKSKVVAKGYLDSHAADLQLVRANGLDYYDLQTRTGYWFTAHYDDKRIARVYAGYSIFDLDQSLVARAFALRPGPFGDAFRDLSIAGRDSESIPLEKLEAQLEEKLARGGDAFEIFGLKLPGEQVTSFGILFLLCAQLYLLLYLRQLRGNLTGAGDGWNVPWMALEGSWMGQSMYAFSLALAPAAICLLQYGPLRRAFDSRGGWLVSIVVFLSALLSIALAVACWVYRPVGGQSRQRHVPPQISE
jgi:hypothetical protein